jgi:alanine racemase
MTSRGPMRAAFSETRARSQPVGHRATWAEVDLDAIRSNVDHLRASSSAASFMAVVKADGYGHGLVQSAQAALEGGADWLGVALVEEGIALRMAGIDAPILVLSEPPVSAVPALVASRLTPSVYTEPFTDALEDEAHRIGVRLSVHLKLDTGMRRVGVSPDDWPDAFRRLARAPSLHVEGIWSHLAVADQPCHPFTDRQATAFARGVDAARAAGLRPELLHLCNSAATQLRSDLHLDLVRCGLSVYGLAPVSEVPPPPGLRPALSWYARLTLVKPVRSGDPVGYGLRWRSPVDTVVGTIAAGYADGLRRGLSGKGHVVWNGRRVPLAGSICMDQAVVDLGPGAPAHVGDDVALLGGDLGDRVTAADWARWLDTITYEIVCSIGARVPRVYLGGRAGPPVRS